MSSKKNEARIIKKPEWLEVPPDRQMLCIRCEQVQWCEPRVNATGLTTHSWIPGSFTSAFITLGILGLNSVGALFAPITLPKVIGILLALVLVVLVVGLLDSAAKMRDFLYARGDAYTLTCKKCGCDELVPRESVRYQREAKRLRELHLEPDPDAETPPGALAPRRPLSLPSMVFWIVCGFFMRVRHQGR